MSRRSRESGGGGLWPYWPMIMSAIALTGVFAGDPDHKGEKNHFSVSGRVLAVGEHSVKLKVVKIEKADGEAKKEFRVNGVTQVHDNYIKCDGEYNDLERADVGKESDKSGKPQTLKGVLPNEWVQLDGAMRDSYNDECEEDEIESRPVYDHLQEIPS